MTAPTLEARRAGRMAVILAALAAVGLAVGAAWGADPGPIVHTPALPNPEVNAVYRESLAMPPEPAPARPVHAEPANDPFEAALEGWIARTEPERPPMPPALPPEPLETLLEELLYRSIAAMLAATEPAPRPALPVHAEAANGTFEAFLEQLLNERSVLIERSVRGAVREPGVYRWPVAKVIDGHTIKVNAAGDFPPELATLNVRLRGVDTPEKGGRAKCDAERRAGRAATAFTAAAVAGGGVTFRNLAWGKYGGRVLADASVDGRLLADRLVIEGHGRAYDGGKRKPWC